jgi:hypothetical protein
VDHEGKVLDIVVQRERDKAVATKPMRKPISKLLGVDTLTQRSQSSGARPSHAAISCARRHIQQVVIRPAV